VEQQGNRAGMFKSHDLLSVRIVSHAAPANYLVYTLHPAWGHTHTHILLVIQNDYGKTAYEKLF